VPDPETGSWPCEADPEDPLTALRIPVVRSPFPRCRYQVCLVIDPAGVWGTTLRPVDAEARQIASYLDWLTDGRPVSRKIQRRNPFDIGRTADTVALIKLGDHDWCYRRRSWRTGPPLVPARYDGEDAADLGRLLDVIAGAPPKEWYRRSWPQWKTAHPETFDLAGDDARREP
jgi:hypothetical protein